MKPLNFLTTFPVDITGMMRPEIGKDFQNKSALMITPWELIVVSFPSKKASVEVTEKDGLTTITVMDTSLRTKERIEMLSKKLGEFPFSGD